ncbi:T/G mismatch-specific endonuclease [Congregibacter litoralis KT71]|uniref:Very short patch repair endonuclease n=2 Tax=Congregibacter TaxID=393661 RepID=A4ABD9_9GAMM|nr:T/G mismatch-specific endonuclease [Congregibacter litoralis KT71]
MAGIRGSNTKPELLLRKGLHALGFRYKLHDKTLPGKPDLVFPRYKAVIFANGCFWHCHNCHLFKWPKSRAEFWQKKISGNVARDEQVSQQLKSSGWRVLRVWECALKGKTRIGIETVLSISADWLRGTEAEKDVRGYE